MAWSWVDDVLVFLPRLGFIFDQATGRDLFAVSINFDFAPPFFI